MADQRGFTVTELVASLALTVILASLALFQFSEMSNRSLNGASALAGFLKTARAKALATTQAYTITPRSNTSVGTSFGRTCDDVTQTVDQTLVLDLPHGAILPDTSWSICYGTRGLSNTSITIAVSDHSSTNTVQIVLGGGVRVL